MADFVYFIAPYLVFCLLGYWFGWMRGFYEGRNSLREGK